MPDLALCRVCLADNIKMHVITNTRYQEMFEKLTGKTVSNSECFCVPTFDVNVHT